MMKRNNPKPDNISNEVAEHEFNSSNNYDVPPHIRLTKDWLDKWLPVLNDRELKTYLRIASHYNQRTKISFPSQKHIALSIGKASEKTANQAISKLEEHGLIDIYKRKVHSGFIPNVYRMPFVNEKGYHMSTRQQQTISNSYKELDEFYKINEYYFENYPTCREFLYAVKRKYPEFTDYIESTKCDLKVGFDVHLCFSLWLNGKIKPVMSGDNFHKDIQPKLERDYRIRISDSFHQKEQKLKNILDQQDEVIGRQVMELQNLLESFDNSTSNAFSEFVPFNFKTTKLWILCDEIGIHPAHVPRCLKEHLESLPIPSLLLNNENYILNISLPQIELSDRDYILIFPDFCNGDNIEDFLKEDKDKIREIRLRYLTDISNALLSDNAKIFQDNKFNSDGSDNFNLDKIKKISWGQTGDYYTNQKLSKIGMLRFLNFKLNHVVKKINESCEIFNDINFPNNTELLEEFPEDYLLSRYNETISNNFESSQ